MEAAFKRSRHLRLSFVSSLLFCRLQFVSGFPVLYKTVPVNNTHRYDKDNGTNVKSAVKNYSRIELLLIRLQVCKQSTDTCFDVGQSELETKITKTIWCDWDYTFELIGAFLWQFKQKSRWIRAERTTTLTDFLKYNYQYLLFLPGYSKCRAVRVNRSRWNTVLQFAWLNSFSLSVEQIQLWLYNLKRRIIIDSVCLNWRECFRAISTS